MKKSKFTEEQIAFALHQADNGPEFISLALGKWAYDNDVTLDFSRPGKPTDNAFIESLTVVCEMNALIRTGSCPCPTRAKSSKTGDRITIIFGHIRR